MEQQTFGAIIGTQHILFHAPNPTKAFDRALSLEEPAKRVKKLFLCQGKNKQIIWDPFDNWGVIAKPPRNWKWWWRLVVDHCFWHPITPFFLFIKAFYPPLKLPSRVQLCLS